MLRNSLDYIHVFSLCVSSLSFINVFFQLNGGTYPGRVQELFGGVGRNVADCLSRIGVNPLFISAIGDDSHKAPFQVHCKHMVSSYTEVIWILDMVFLSLE